MGDRADVRVRVAVLGPLAVRDATGHDVTPQGQQARTLLASLCLAGRPLSVADLVDDLWGDSPPRNAKAALHTLVSRARANGPGALITSTPTGYGLAVTREQTDLGVARASTASAQQLLSAGDIDAAAATAGEALALWRGAAGSDLVAGSVRDELERRAASLWRELLRIHAVASVDQGRYEAALADLEGIPESLATDDLVELRMRALAGLGRRSDALRVFADHRRRVRDELGVEPAASLAALHTSLLREDRPDATTPVKRGVRSAGTSLLGRDDDVTRLESLLSASRVVTILGPGGLGKTRLAHHLAQRSDLSVAVVELAGVRAGEDVTGAFASALGIHEVRVQRLSLDDPAVRTSVTERILAVLEERPMLLVVDNCEHVIDAAAAWVDDVVARTRHTRVLATSRAPLAIASEQTYPLPALPVTGEGDSASAVALFAERARAARPGVTLPLDTVRALCERLDGLPLAIELAAARVRSLSVEDVLARLTDRFTLLDAGRRGGPDRHRTLSAVIDWSWNLLNARQQAMASRLAYFASGFGVEAAEAVAGTASDDILSDLDAVVTQSLLTVSEEPTTGQLRYRMLETVREYAYRRVVDAGGEPEVRAAAHAWAARFAASALGKLDGPEQVAALQQVAVEHDNLVSTIREAAEDREPEVVAVVFSVLTRFWIMRGAFNEVFAFSPLVFEALCIPRGEGRLRDARNGHQRSSGERIGGDGRQAGPLPSDARAMATAIVAFALGAGGNSRDAARARSQLRRLRQTAELTDPLTLVVADLTLAWGSPGRLRQLVERAAQSSDPSTSGTALLIAAQITENAGDVELALALTSEAVEKSAVASNLWLRSLAELGMAEIHSQSARPSEVGDWASRAQGHFESLGAPETFAQVDWLVALSLISLGQLDEAEEQFRGLLGRVTDGDVGREARDLELIAVSGLAEVAWARGEREHALQLFMDASADVMSKVRETNPWALIVASATLIVLAESGSIADARTFRLATSVRRATRVLTRLRERFSDRPVLGGVLVGLARWYLDAVDSRVGVELLALAERLSSRQDLPTLHRDRHFAHAAAETSAEVVERARKEAGRLSLDEAAERALELLRLSRPPV